MMNNIVIRTVVVAILAAALQGFAQTNVAIGEGKFSIGDLLGVPVSDNSNAASDASRIVDVRLSESKEVLRLSVADNEIKVVPVTRRKPDLVVEMTQPIWQAVFLGKTSVVETVADKSTKVTGPPEDWQIVAEAFERVTKLGPLFQLPDPALLAPGSPFFPPPGPPFTPPGPPFDPPGPPPTKPPPFASPFLPPLPPVP